MLTVWKSARIKKNRLILGSNRSYIVSRVASLSESGRVWRVARCDM